MKMTLIGTALSVATASDSSTHHDCGQLKGLDEWTASGPKRDGVHSSPAMFLYTRSMWLPHCSLCSPGAPEDHNVFIDQQNLRDQGQITALHLHKQLPRAIKPTRWLTRRARRERMLRVAVS
ncbi:hypothetical protein ElyMa_002377600 [Elysia marginata]|uniref:Secreted protein n=1 Tax=Elysia marginata TaxID=1093978 RepID=A0AAV4GBH6_9GAST|nr:hypothetical protein ElyMa_002377600 [Elysia marginata]